MGAPEFRIGGGYPTEALGGSLVLHTRSVAKSIKFGQVPPANNPEDEFAVTREDYPAAILDDLKAAPHNIGAERLNVAGPFNIASPSPDHTTSLHLLRGKRVEKPGFQIEERRRWFHPGMLG